MTTTAPLITERLGAHLAALRSRPLPAGVLAKAASCLFDAVGLGVAAGSEPTTTAYLRTLHTLPAGPGTVRLWPSDASAVLSEAVAGNAFATHSRFQDDCDMASWSHPGSLVVPAVVGCAEATGASLDAVLRGIVAGYGAIHWLGGDGVLGHAMVRRGFRTSPTLGGIGAAAGTAVVLGLDAERAGHAVAMAAAIAGGVLDTVRSGSADFRLQNAVAAGQGLAAALAAREGIDGSATIFDSEVGFLRCFAGRGDTTAFPADPTGAEILDSWAKPFPALGDNMAVIAAALAVHRQGGLDPAAVRRVTVHQNADFAAYPGTGYRGPFTRPTQAIASTAYGVAAMLARGRLHYADYLGPLDDPAITDLVGKTEIIPETGFGYLDGVVEVDLGGETRRGATGDLPATLFHRDQAATLDALTALFAEVGRDTTGLAGLVDEVHATLGADGPAIGTVLDRLRATAKENP